MRTINTPLVAYEDTNGQQVNIHDLIEIPKYDTAIVIDGQRGVMPDEIMTRPNVGGENAEILVFQLVEANILELTENDLQFDSLKKIKIPPV